MKTMQNFKLMHEDDKHYSIHDGKGVIKIAKSSLSPELHTKLKTLVPHVEQHEVKAPKKPKVGSLALADGGKAEKLDIEPEPQESEGGVEYEELTQPEPKEHLDYEEVQNYADGGDVDSDSEATPSDSKIDVKPDEFTDMVNTLNPFSADKMAAAQQNAQQGFAQDQASLPTTPSAQPQMLPDGSDKGPVPGQLPSVPVSSASGPITPNPNAAASAAQGPAQEYNQGLALQQQGARNYAKAVGTQGENAAQAYSDQLDGIQAVNAQFDTQLNTLNAQNQQLFEYLSNPNNKVDPNRYYKNMNTGQRIGAAIAIALGGLGGGLQKTGQNAALTVIDRSIQRDIDAQANDLQNKQNLLSKNLAQVGNIQQAKMLTYSQLAATAAAQVAQAGGLAQGALAKSQADQLVGQLMQNGSQMHMQFARFGNQMALANGSSQQINPEALDEKTRERLVQLPNGRQALAYSSKDAGTVKEELSLISPIMKQLDRIDSLGPAALIPGSPANNQAMALRASLVPKVNEYAGLKRLSSEDIHNILQQVNDPTSFMQLVGGRDRSQVLRQDLTDKLQGKIGQYLEGSPTGAGSGQQSIPFRPVKR